MCTGFVETDLNRGNFNKISYSKLLNNYLSIKVLKLTYVETNNYAFLFVDGLI